MVEERYPALKRILKAPAAYAEPEIRAASSDVTEKRSSGNATMNMAYYPFASNVMSAKLFPFALLHALRLLSEISHRLHLTHNLLHKV